METKTEQKTPILVVTSDRWSRETYVVFEGDEILGGLILDSWVDDAYRAASENYDEITREQVAEQIEEDFFSENTDVDAFWPEHGVLRCGTDYYTYTDNGICEWVKDNSGLPIEARLKMIIEDKTGRPGQNKSGSVLAIAQELLDRIARIDDLVIVGNPWCIEPMVYTTDEISDESMWTDGCPDEYTNAETWIDENE